MINSEEVTSSIFVPGHTLSMGQHRKWCNWTKPPHQPPLLPGDHWTRGSGGVFVAGVTSHMPAECGVIMQHVVPCQHVIRPPHTTAVARNTAQWDHFTCATESSASRESKNHPKSLFNFMPLSPISIFLLYFMIAP